MIELTNISVFSDKGKRTENEDRASFLIGSSPGEVLLVLADGMGGHEGGEEASELVTQTLLHYFAEHGFEPPEQQLEDALKKTQQCVLQNVIDSPQYTGMGSTVVAVTVRPEKGVVASVGDSRAYQFRDDCVRRLTRDDLYVSHLLGIDDRVARKHPQGHVLSQAIGIDGDLTPHIHGFDVQPADIFLLCSDGVHEVLNEPTMRMIIATSKPAEAAMRIVHAAMDAGSTDNCSAVVAQMPQR